MLLSEPKPHSLPTFPVRPLSWQVSQLRQLSMLRMSAVGWDSSGWQSLALLAGSLRRLDLHYCFS